jgi:hypothetical protein
MLPRKMERSTLSDQLSAQVYSLTLALSLRERVGVRVFMTIPSRIIPIER